MVDRLSAARRSWLMGRVKSRDTKPELIVRSALHGLGYRYVLHDKTLFGTPDLVFPRRSKIIFVHGCFWHGHHCKYGQAKSKSNIDFWEAKIQANSKRDKRNIKKLRRAGWSVMTVWECEIKNKTWLNRTVSFLDRCSPAPRK